MNITDLAVRRPTAILMGVALILGLGVVGYVNLGADLFPAVNTPVITIRSSYTGAGAEEVDKQVIKPIEDAVSGINGIETIRSTSGTGFGYTILQFTMSTDMSSAILDVQQALNGVADALPREATRPVMAKFDVNSQPILIVSITGSGTTEELSNQADRLRDDIESLPGVGSASVVGSEKKELLITADRTAMEYYGVSPGTLLSVVKAQNLDIPAGDIRQKARQLSVRLVGEFSGVEDVRSLRIPTGGGGSVRLSEIAQVALDYPDPKTSVRLNTHPTIGIFVRKQSDANVVTTADAVKAELTALGPTLPPGTSLTIASDATVFINSSLAETRLNLVESIITTSLVLFLFLRRWRSSLIVLVAIPVSLVGTFFAMWAFHFTLNVVSLMALGLCIGILVDDSIVILENIDRHIALGELPRAAAVNGRKEIALAAVAITLCDVVVFAPIAFMTDIVGQFFRQFGLTVVCATLLSLLVSFTVTPMMAARMLGGSRERTSAPPSEESGGKPVGFLGRLFETGIKGTYRRFLEWSLNHRAAVILPVILLVAASIALVPLKVVETEFMPTADQGKLVVDMDLGAGAGYTQTNAKVKIVEAQLSKIPEVEDSFATIGSSISESTSQIIVKLRDKSKRRKGQAQVARELRDWGRGLPGVLFSVTEPGIISRTSIEGSKPLIINVSGPSRDVLRGLAGRVEDVLRSVPGAADVDNTMRSGQTEVSVQVNRLAASSYGLSTADVALVMRTALAGTDAGVYRHAGDEYDMVVRYRQDQLRRPEDLGALKVTNPAGQQISLSQVASFVRTDSAREILRRDRQNVATISANTAGRPLGALTAEIKAKMAGVTIPFGYEVGYTGDQQNMSSSFGSLSWALGASLLLVFMILVVLYESFLTPFIRMLSIPCGIIGAFAALAITGKAINTISFIGLIMLDGLISKNGTLLIDYTHTLMKKGMPLREALVEAGITRLRPILMTSVTMIVGMLPLALSLGASSEIRSGMAVVLIGGLVTSTLLTPILLPVVYTLIEDLRSSRARRTGGELPEHGGYAR
jgi:hydrophobic/amphiphilic exporter-1 (mainly G- bacteria), HAE1 family